MSSLNEMEAALRRLTAQAAADRFLAALKSVERKYRLDQARWPKGTSQNGKVGAGRFADEGRGETSRALRSAAGRAAGNLAIRAAIANPEVAVAAVVGTGVGVGARQLAVTRGTGYYSRTAGGGATPFLGQPITLIGDDSGINRSSPQFSPTERDEIHDTCERQEDLDRSQCLRWSMAKDIPEKKKQEFIEACNRNAYVRYVDCASNGGEPSGKPLFPVWWGKEFRNNREQMTSRTFPAGGKAKK